MTSTISSGVEGAMVGHVPDGAYLPLARELVAASTRRCLCSIFIVDLDPVRDTELRVDSLIQELTVARWRGVDTRLVIGGSRTNIELAKLAVGSLRWCEKAGLPTRWLSATDVRGSHRKVLVADDAVLTGSHNWSPGAFGGDQTQDSVVVESPPLADRLAALLESQWRRAAGG